MAKQTNKLLTIALVVSFLISMFAFLVPVKANVIFSDDFSSGNFNAWTATYASPTISDGKAVFTVTSGDGAQCYAEKDQLTIDSDGSLAVSTSVCFNTIPTNGQGNSGIFFSAIADSSDPGNALVYATVDGSQHFGLWIGEWPDYIWVYDTTLTVQANTYYNVTIQLDNQNQQVKLIVDGQTKITEDYTDNSQFQNSDSVDIVNGIVENYAWTTVQVHLDYAVASDGLSNQSTAFQDDFSSGNFNAWTSTYGNPTVSNGVAVFTVTTGDGAECYAEKDQLSIDSNSVFSLSTIIRFSTIPTSGQGNAGIYFSAISDSSSPENALVYATVDGSQHFGLWIGEWPNYIWVYDTTLTVQANTYYNVTIQLDNQNEQVKLVVDGQTKITYNYTEYSQFQNSESVDIATGIVANYDPTTVEVRLDSVVTNGGPTSTYYTITASAGSGGSISPLGQIQVIAGENRTFTITAYPGRSITNVTVDGQDQGNITSYTFSNVQANHIITALFSSTTPESLELHTSGNQILDANNTEVYLKGMGLAGYAPDLYFWGPGGIDAWGDQWIISNETMDQTFQCLQQEWGVNMIRVFILPEWFLQDNIVPAQVDPSSYPGYTTPISTRNYLQALCQRAAVYNIYVDIVPYQLTACSGSFESDPYLTPNQGGAQGTPFSWNDEQATDYIASTGLSEQQFWNYFWTTMADTFKDYPNAIFEAWNEPQPGYDTDPVSTGYMTYLQTMYDAIRSNGSTNLIFMQWHMGWFPNGYGHDLSWASQIWDEIDNPSNLVFTTHLYYYAPSDLTPFWGTDCTTSSVTSQLQAGIATMGVSAPLVFNEAGSCLGVSNDVQQDYYWWSSVCQASANVCSGLTGYYWLSDEGLGGVFLGETLLAGAWQTGTPSPPPNEMGQIFIDDA